MKSLREDRARQFAAKYVKNGFNPVQAVVDCGITSNRFSAHVIGYRLLRNVMTQKLINDHLTKSKMDADEVVQRLSDIARADIAEVLEPDGSFDIAKAQARNKSKLIKSLKFDKDSGKVVGLETYSAHEGQRDIGKIHKLFVDKVETTDLTDNQTALTFLSRRINKIAQKTGKSEQEVELELQTELSDKSDEDYSADLDSRVHPESWPSGNLLENQQVSEITEIGDQ